MYNQLKKNIYSYCITFQNLFQQYLERKQYDKALKAWAKATKQKPTCKQAWTNMILLLYDLGLYESILELIDFCMFISYIRPTKTAYNFRYDRKSTANSE